MALIYDPLARLMAVGFPLAQAQMLMADFVTNPVTAPLTYSATNAPTARAAQDRAVDAINIKDYGAICDGNSHPLSATYATLAAAQAVYPHAVSLTDEIDWCAIQGAVNAGLGVISIPTGIALINHPIVSNTTGNITVLGNGPVASFILQTAAGADGWQHTSAYWLQMYGLTLMCNGVGGTALNLNFTGAVSNLVLRDVYIYGNGSHTTNYWHDGIIAANPANSIIDGVAITGIQAANLAAVGNGVYIQPKTTPSIGISVVVSIKNSSISYYQKGIVLDSTGRNLGTDLQGVVLDWVNMVGVMQGVSVLGNIVEFVMHKCQIASYGSFLYAEGGQGCVVRDCYAIMRASDTNAIAAQLPQDVIQLVAGTNWRIEDNWFSINPSTTCGYVFNLSGNLLDVGLYNNRVQAVSATAASGYINIQSPAAYIRESGSHLSAFTWPLYQSDATYGGTSNKCEFFTRTTRDAPDGTQFLNQGAILGWGYGATGETDFFNSKGGGAGGFNFYNVASTSGATPTLVAALTDNQFALGHTGTANTWMTITGDAGSARNIAFQSAGSQRWVVQANNTAEAGGNAGSNFYITRFSDAGGSLGTPFSITRSSGLVTMNAGVAISGASTIDNAVIGATTPVAASVTALNLTNSSGPNIRSGAGAATGTQPSGSIWVRTDGSAGARIYVSAGGGTWTPIAGV